MLWLLDHRCCTILCGSHPPKPQCRVRVLPVLSCANLIFLWLAQTTCITGASLIKCRRFRGKEFDLVRSSTEWVRIKKSSVLSSTSAKMSDRDAVRDLQPLSKLSVVFPADGTLFTGRLFIGRRTFVHSVPALISLAKSAHASARHSPLSAGGDFPPSRPLFIYHKILHLIRNRRIDCATV